MATPENTLLIKNVPKELSAEDKVELLQHFGATHVRCMPPNGRMRHCVFATFPSGSEASLAISRLHQLQVLGRRLTAVHATSVHDDRGYLPHLSDPNRPIKSSVKSEKSSEGQDELLTKVEEFQKWLAGIHPDIGIGYPRCPLLHYRYPAPTQTIVSNIAHALIAVPKFYTQVLHLMNAMNLPAPFQGQTPTPPLPLEEQTEIQEEEEMDLSTEESEMESDTENKRSSVEPAKRPLKDKKRKRVVKRPRLFPTIPQVAAPSAPAVDPSSVFDTTDVDTSTKKISIHIRPADEVSAAVPEEARVEAGGFGVLEPPQLQASSEGDLSQEGLLKWKEAKFVSRHEIERNRISSREMKGMSVYKNYQAGEPTCRLYVKNLAKQTNEMDLFNIYGRYVNQNFEQERDMFDIRLMKEGRMKGQAFVTLASASKAQDALRDTNGYLLHGKPIVVQYARSAKPKEQERRK